MSSTSPHRIFISTEMAADARVVRVIELLKAAGLTVKTSPINPVDDPRWKGWYKSGCQTALESSDVFLAIETAGYGSSTWMAVEFDTAWKLNRALGRPRLFVLHRSARPLPAGFRQYVEASLSLPLEVNEAVPRLLEVVADPTA
jgi:hypothetical protein